MSRSIAPLLLPLLFALFVNHGNSDTSADWINRACNFNHPNFDISYCINRLGGISEITNKTKYMDFFISLVRVGNNNLPNVLQYIDDEFKSDDPPPSESEIRSLKGCKSAFDRIQKYFEIAMEYMLFGSMKDAAQNFLQTGNDVDLCEKSMAANGYENDILDNCNRNARVYSFASYNVANGL